MQREVRKWCVHGSMAQSQDKNVGDDRRKKSEKERKTKKSKGNQERELKKTIKGEEYRRDAVLK